MKAVGITSTEVPIVPRWRGVVHLFAACTWPVVVFLLVANATNAAAFQAALVFGIGNFVMFAASANLHRGRRPSEDLRRRLDHACIFVGMAASATPLMLAVKTPEYAVVSVWVIAGLGAALKLVWATQPDWLSGSAYTVFGLFVPVALWMGERPIPEFAKTLLILATIPYLLSAAVFILQWPRWEARRWGGHEWFHVFQTTGHLFITAAVLFWALAAIAAGDTPPIP